MENEIDIIGFLLKSYRYYILMELYIPSTYIQVYDIFIFRKL